MNIRLTEKLSDAVPIDMSHYLWRDYEFPNGSVVRITKPIWLVITKQGTHRLLDADDVCHWIPAPYSKENTGGFIHISYKVRDDTPHFRF